MFRRLTPCVIAATLILSSTGWSASEIAAATRAPAASVVVNTLDDTTGECAASGTGTCTLRDAITFANSNEGADSITFSVSGSITLTNSLPAIGDTLSIDGSAQSVSVSGNDTYRAFFIASTGNVTLTHLTIMSGTVPFGGGSCLDVCGGGIYVDMGGKLVVEDSLIQGNRASGGGGVYNAGAIWFYNSLVMDNRSEFEGGALRNEGTLIIQNSTFSGNSATNGGGIYSSGALTLTNSTLSGNSATQGGGGIYNHPSGALTVSNSTFSGNSISSSALGGGILNLGLLNVVYSIFSNNSGGVGAGVFNGGALTMSNSVISSNNAGNGGGIYNHPNGALTLTSSTFSDNSAGGGSGGGGINNGGALTLTNSTFSGNSASNGGGGIDNFGMLTLTNSTFSGNSAGIGGGIHSYFGAVTLRNTIVNDSPSGGNCAGSIINGGNNLDSGTTCGWGSANGSLSNSEPRLGALAGNGGSTQTFALLPDSAAIDGVTFDAPNACPATDQRGVARPIAVYCDIGAYEANITHVFLPIISQSFVDMPDLIVSNLIAGTNAVTVVIQNIGAGPVTDEFWVDFYVNPNPAPTAVNQVWNDGRSSQGVVWGVTASAFSSLVPGGMLTLTLSSPYYRSDLSQFSGIAGGTALYAQVDSANTNTSYGAMLETHEANGGTYNNILGPVLSSPGTADETTTSPTNSWPSSRSGQLPRR